MASEQSSKSYKKNWADDTGSVTSRDIKEMTEEVFPPLTQGSRSFQSKQIDSCEKPGVTSQTSDKHNSEPESSISITSRSDIEMHQQDGDSNLDEYTNSRSLVAAVRQQCPRQPISEPQPMQPQATVDEEGWSTTIRRGKTRKQMSTVTFGISGDPTARVISSKLEPSSSPVSTHPSARDPRSCPSPLDVAPIPTHTTPSQFSYSTVVQEDQTGGLTIHDRRYLALVNAYQKQESSLNDMNHELEQLGVAHGELILQNQDLRRVLQYYDRRFVALEQSLEDHKADSRGWVAELMRSG